MDLAIPVCGMVKDDFHRTRALYYNNEIIEFPKNSEAFRMITRLQDEAHRFAITYHKALRGKEQVHSVLDDIKGIGPARRKSLMKHFKDIGKVKEISAFPVNDYTDDGQLLGHIVMGAQMVGERAAKIDGFPHNLLAELQHCILAHHGKLEYGSPKVPALIEAVALNYADDTDAKMETFKEILENNSENSGWLGYNRLFESNLRATKME